MWTYIDEIVIGANANQIYVDTRDFYCLIKEERLDLRDSRQPQITRVLYRREFLLHESKVKGFIKNLETITGGKGSWRMMNFDKIPTKCGWFKYVRFYRVKGDYFVVCNDDNVPVIYSLMNSENLEREYLYFY